MRMSAALRTLLVVLAVSADAANMRATATMEMETGANPVRRIVTMLQMMSNKVEAEGKKMAELFDKFMCYCQTAEGDLGKSIAEAEDKIPQLQSAIEEGTEQKKQLDDAIVKHKEDRSSAEEAIAEATAMRGKESAAFAKDSSEMKANIDAMAKAIPAIEKGMSGFLQTDTAQVLRKITLNADLSGEDRETLSAFLSQKNSQNDNDNDGEDSPGSGEILGILKQLKEEMEKDLAELTTQEDKAAADFEALVNAKKKEIAAATKAIEEKTVRVGELGVEIVTNENDLEDTEEALEEDKKVLAGLDKNCALKKKEYAVYEKMMSQELVAISDTIKILNDDDALDLFKKTLPSAAAASFLQIAETPTEVRQRALKALRGGHKKHQRSVRVDFIALALRGKQTGFDKVITLIDEMVVLLGKEQDDDDKKKAYCEAEFDKSDDEKKALTKDISDVSKAIAEQEDMIESLAEEVAGLEKGIEALDKSVAEATEQRKEENAEYTETLAANNAAKELIEIAKNRLAKFYNPKLYKPPPKRELSEEERITLNMGGTLAPTNPPGGIAGTGVSFVQVKTHRELEEDDQTSDQYQAPDISFKKKEGESGGVMAMMDGLKADLDKEILEMEMEEKDAQEDYEAAMKDAAAKRATDSKAITEKSGAKAELEEECQKNKDSKKASDSEMMELEMYLMELHKDCDFLLENYGERKEARANEVDAMKKARAVLSGADYSLLQLRSSTKRLRHA